MPRKFKDLSEEEKRVLIPLIEAARQAKAKGDVQAEQQLKTTISKLAKSFDLDPANWSLEALNKTGCLVFLAIVLTLVLVGCIYR